MANGNTSLKKKDYKQAKKNLGIFNWTVIMNTANGAKAKEKLRKMTVGRVITPRTQSGSINLVLEQGAPL